MEKAPKDVGQNINSTTTSTGQRKTEKEKVERERVQIIAQICEVSDRAHNYRARERESASARKLWYTRKSQTHPISVI